MYRVKNCLFKGACSRRTFGWYVATTLRRCVGISLANWVSQKEYDTRGCHGVVVEEGR